MSRLHSIDNEAVIVEIQDGLNNPFEMLLDLGPVVREDPIKLVVDPDGTLRVNGQVQSIIPGNIRIRVSNVPNDIPPKQIKQLSSKVKSLK